MVEKETDLVIRKKSLLRYISLERIGIQVIFMFSLILIAYFIYFSILWNVVVSLSDWRGLTESYNIVGFDQYFKMFTDSTFLISLTNNFLLLLYFIPSTIVIGLFLAILLDQQVRREGVFRMIYLLPFTLSFVVTGFLWRWMYNPSLGVINSLLDMFGLSFLKTGWTSDPSLALICVVISMTWQFSGYTMLIFLAGIRSIPKSHVLAAKVDGASGFQLYRKIIIPQIKSSTFTAFVILMVVGLKVFDLIYILTDGGPGYATEILPLTMYKETFAASHFAYGSAIATILFLFVMILVVPYLYKTYKVKK